MNSKEKRDRVVKEVIKPLMKKEGFKSKGLHGLRSLRMPGLLYI